MSRLYCAEDIRFRLALVWLEMIFSWVSLLDKTGDTEDARSFDDLTGSMASWFNSADIANEPLRLSSSDCMVSFIKRKEKVYRVKKKRIQIPGCGSNLFFK
jgi:hypothetical protein